MNRISRLFYSMLIKMDEQLASDIILDANSKMDF
jgi:hypothetical protein